MTSYLDLKYFIDGLSCSNNFFHTCTGRALHLALVPVSFIRNAAYTIAGIGEAIKANCSCGVHKPLGVTLTYLGYSRQLLTEPYMLFLRMINPKAAIPVISQTCSNGILTPPISYWIKNRAGNYAKRGKFAPSRLTHALLPLACLVTRAVDGIIGIGAAVLSILTAGKFASLNDIAFRGLLAPDIIMDLFDSTFHIVNPNVQLYTYVYLIPRSKF